jgi:hypothetical protein
MAGGLLKKLGELFLPEKFGADQASLEDPLAALNSVYNRLLHLAAQIESHAQAAPYPHVRQRLLKIAAEKRASAQQLKKAIESHGATVREFVKLPVSGSNHWERIKRDLEDQKALEDLLALYEPRLRRASPEIADCLVRLGATEAAHRETLRELFVVADPQATQT